MSPEPPLRLSINHGSGSKSVEDADDARASSKLAAMLHRDRLATTVFSTASVERLVALYTSCRKANDIESLSDEVAETLVTVCGTYSSMNEVPNLVSRRVKIADTLGHNRKGYWRFVLEVLEEKAGRRELSAVERYWRLEGWIHGLRERPQLLNEQTMIRRAMEDYVAIRPLIEEEAIHVSLFQAVYSFGDRSQLVCATGYLCDVLAAVQGPSPSLVTLFWNYILALGLDVSNQVQEKILAIIRFHISGAQPEVHPLVEHPHNWPDKGFLTVKTLSRVFATSTSATISPTHPHPTIQTWAFRHTQEAFSLRHPPSIRWTNALLLAKALSPTPPTRTSSRPLNLQSLTPIGTWQIVLALSCLESTLNSLELQGLLTSANAPSIQAYTNQVWMNWVRLDPEANPVAINQAVLISFLKLAASLGDEDLLDRCGRYCRDQGLWHWPPGASDATRRQAIGLVSAYVHAMGSCRGHYDWDRLYKEVSHLVSDPASIRDLLSYTLPLLLPRDLDHANALLEFASRENVVVSSRSLLPFALHLAEAQRWSVIMPLLGSNCFSDSQREAILIAIFRVFQTSRLESINRPLAVSLGIHALDVYANIRPSPGSKYPLRHFFRLLVAAHEGSLAVDIISRVFPQTPIMFSQRSIRRYLVELVEHECPTDAVRLFKMAYSHFTLPQAEDFRRKLLARLVDSGATRHAKVVAKYRANRTQTFKRSSAEQIIRLILERRAAKARPSVGVKQTLLKSKRVRKRRLPLSQRRRRWITAHASGPTLQRGFESLRILAILNADPHPSATAIRSAISVLARHGRLLEAHAVFARFGKHLDGHGRAALGNIIVYRQLRKAGPRSKRALHRLFQLCDTLGRECGFEPDRATVNILISAIIAHDGTRAASSLRSSFDSVVEMGYLPMLRGPTGNEVRLDGGSSGRMAAPVNRWLTKLPVVDQAMNFKRHIEPLFRTFIKQFQRRGDRDAAGTVIGLLKAGETEDLERREGQARSRRMGIERKRARERAQRDGIGVQ